MYGASGLTWNDCEIQKLEAVQNKIGRVALGANGYAGVEAIRGDMGWSSFYERYMKACVLFKVRIDKMENDRWVKRVHLMTKGGSKWMKTCRRLARKCGLSIRNTSDAPGVENEWKIRSIVDDSSNWSVDKWYKVVKLSVREYGLQQWKKGMMNKTTLVWYRMKDCPKYEWWYDGSWGSELLFKARCQALEVNARTYRWNDRKTKECFMCACGIDESVYHVIVECEAYEQERSILMQIISSEIDDEFLLRWDGSKKEGMCLLLGIDGNVNGRVIEAMKGFLVNAWRMRSVQGEKIRRKEHAYCKY